MTDVSLTQEDDRVRRSDVETSEDERSRILSRSLRRKAAKLTRSLRIHSKRVAHCQFASFSAEDLRDEKEEEAVYAFRKALIKRDQLPLRYDDYHTMLRAFDDTINGFNDDGWPILTCDGGDDVIIVVNSTTNIMIN